MILTKILIWLLGAAAAWWVSGFDPRVTGENPGKDYWRRAARCLATAVMLGVFFMPDAVHVGIGFIPLLFIIPPSIGILWAGCLGAFLARGFHCLFDPEDRRPFDPGEDSRNLDRVAGLLKNGRREEAAQLCAELKKAGHANALVLDTMLARAGIAPEAPKRVPPIVEAHRLRAEGKFAEAEMILRSLLAENPANVDAALMLIRLYVHDLRRSGQAAEVLRSLGRQPRIPAGHIEYARRLITEPERKEPREPAAVLPESADELLAGGYLGTAIEMLEGKIRERPDDFALWLKLAEAHGCHSGNLRQAERIIRKMESNPAFSPEQMALARARLAEWRGAKPPPR